MRKIVIVSIYLAIMVLIFSTHQSRWFGKDAQSKQSNLTSKFLISEASAFIPTMPSQRPNDPDIHKSWALRDNSAMRIEEAWKIGSCRKGITVAVVDTGIDFNHPDLKANLWKNSGEIPNNGKDDDDNGFIDDVMGWDFVENDHLPQDDHGHGTHVSGIIGAVGGNGIGISGVCSTVSLMILRYYDPHANGRKNLENTIQAFKYAINNGADIINYSGGGSQYSKTEKDMIAEAKKHGILIVAAAGNEQQNADKHGYYPASYNHENILSVAAIDISKSLVNSSNFGTTRIDIAAPGKKIYSTLPNNKYGYMTGTSQATAFVSGIAALALSKDPSLSKKALVLKKILMNSTVALKSLRGKIKTGGAINAQTVLENVNTSLDNFF